MTAFSLHRRYLPIAAGLLSLFVASCESTTKPKTGYNDVVDYTSPNPGLSQEEYPFDKNGNYLADVVSGKTKGRPASSSSKPVAAARSNPYMDTYEKPVITVVGTPPEKPNAIYDRVPEPDSSQPSSSSGGGSTKSKLTSSSSSSTASKTKPKTTTAAVSSSASKTSASRTASAAASKSKAKPATAAAKPQAKSKPQPAKAAPKPTSVSHTVKNGDTLYGLASRYNTSVDAIKKANGLSSNVLRNGRTLKIPRK